MADEQERWAPLPDLPRYEISDQGRLRNCITGKTLKPMLTKRGFRQCSVVREGKPTTSISLHRAVAIAFLPKPDDERPMHKMFLEHLDGDRLNNVVSNLRWTTARR